MANMDTLRIEILVDGTIKTVSDPISAPNHDNAARFVKAMSLLAGGETKVEKRTDAEALARVKHHKHDHGHSHEEGTLKGGR